MTTEEFKTSIMPQYINMYRVAVSVTGNGDEAADAVQDAILRLWDHRNKLNNVSDLKSYCASVVRNVSLNYLQRRKPMSSTSQSYEIMSDDDVHGKLEGNDLSDFVGRAMNRLPPDQRQVLRLSAYGEFSNTEIAEMLGISQGNVRVLLSRARKRLKELLSKSPRYGTK